MTGNKQVKIGGILLAAGGSTRMNTPKQYVTFRGKTLLRSTAESMASSMCEPVIAVLGSESDEAENELAGLRFKLSFNHEWKLGMSSSIKLGLTELISLEPMLDAILITLCDQPLVDSHIIDRLTRHFVETRARMVAAKYADVIGVPALFSKEMFEQLLRLDGDKGARDLLRDPEASIETIEIKEAALDIDTIDDLGRLKNFEHES